MRCPALVELDKNEDPGAEGASAICLNRRVLMNLSKSTNVRDGGEFGPEHLLMPLSATERLPKRVLPVAQVPANSSNVFSPASFYFRANFHHQL